MNSSKNRILYLDVVRVFAIFLVIIHHIHFHFIDSNLYRDDLMWSNYIGNISYGDLGVSLFIFISGAGLTLSIGAQNIYIINFYRKRLLRIYPLFWLIYVFFFIWYTAKRYMDVTIDKHFLLLSLTGIDTYLLSFFKFPSYAFYDWFIGFILLLYLFYPLLYKLYIKNEVILLILSALLIPISVIIFGKGVSVRLITLRLLEFSLGMWYSKVASKEKLRSHLLVFLSGSILFFGLNNLNFPADFMLYTYLLKLIALDLLILEAAWWISSLLASSTFVIKLVSRLASTSYAMFLLQHQLIIRSIYNPNIFFQLLNYNRNVPPMIFATYIICTIIVLGALFTKTEKLLSQFIKITGHRLHRFLITYTS